MAVSNGRGHPPSARPPAGEGYDHAGHVAAWLRDAGAGLTLEERVSLIDQALGALWRRAEVTLGDVTLAAIVDRVLYTTTETHPCLSGLTLGTGGVSFDGLRREGAPDPRLETALPLVLVEFLTVLGTLTDEILTPALYAELTSVGQPSPNAPTDATGP